MLTARLFIEYSIWGAWDELLSTWLSRTLHFSGAQSAKPPDMHVKAPAESRAADQGPDQAGHR